MTEQTYTSVPVVVRRREDQGVYEIGVMVEGAFIPVTAVKLGHFDKLVTLAKTQAEAESQPDQQG